MKKSQERMVGWVGVRSACFGIFSDLFWDFSYNFLHYFYSFFSILASKFGSYRKKGSLLDVKTIFRGDIFKSVW